MLLGLSGGARYLMDGAVHELGPNSLLWAFSGQAHVLLSETPDFDMWVFLISERVLPPGESASMPPLRRPDAGGVAPRRLDDASTRALTEIADIVRAEPCPSSRRTGLRWWLLRGKAEMRRTAGSMSGNGDWRRGRLVVLAVAGLLLLNYPLLELFNEPATGLGVPVFYLYLFLVWGVFIALVALALERKGGVRGPRVFEVDRPER